MYTILVIVLVHYRTYYASITRSSLSKFLKTIYYPSFPPPTTTYAYLHTLTPTHPSNKKNPNYFPSTMIYLYIVIMVMQMQSSIVHIALQAHYYVTLALRYVT